MKKNPMLNPKPNCGHYAACATRMLEIKNFSKTLFIYTVISGALLLFVISMASIAGLGTEVNLNIAGAFSTIPLILAKSGSMAVFYLHILEITVMIVLGVLGLTKYKGCTVAIFAFLVVSFLGGIFVEGVHFISLGTIFCAIGVLISFRSIGVYLDYKQLYETEGFPYFSELFEIPEDSSYKSMYKEQFKNLPKNPERRFGDIAPIPLKPEHQMTDLADTPMQQNLLKRENHQNDENQKSLFEEV